MVYVKYQSDLQPPALGAVQLITTNAILGSALRAALTALGWQAGLVASWQELTSEQRPDQRFRLVLIADDTGALPSWPADQRPADRRLLAVAPRAGLPALAGALERGVIAALDADLPFSELVGNLHRLLLSPISPEQASQFARRLRDRAAEARRFEALTRRERQVLAALVAGHTAADIARHEHLSMPTVRSHIKAVLAKLDSSSQVAAIALTHRSCADPALLEQVRKVHQF